VEVTRNRRERLRAATLDEISQAARKLLTRDGLAGVSLRAIAREMGMTAPGLYRYFPSLEDLLSSLCGSLYDELRENMERARDGCPPDDPAGQLVEVCREFRRWSVAHPSEFGLMFASPIPGLHPGPNPTRPAPTSPSAAASAGSTASAEPGPAPNEAGMRFAGVFMALFAEIWARTRFPVPAIDEIEPGLVVQLEAFLAQLDPDLPVGAAQVFLACWIRLYGMVALEVFGHLHFCLTDPEPMFETELADLGRLLMIAD
jgi:AcrR family transcriptional regulator